jgi:saccharopine dehydrogenase (NADP+, L-glutamate forming)
MEGLDGMAKEAGITVLNEIGLDPGIDHLYAVKMIDEIHAKHAKLLSFLSYCGGLPAPENSGNPLGYKFSWSSRGVLLALRNSAKYWKDGNVCADLFFGDFGETRLTILHRLRKFPVLS